MLPDLRMKERIGDLCLGAGVEKRIKGKVSGGKRK
jgi:hypothetical protein